jgi:hypothetical protein
MMWQENAVTNYADAPSDVTLELTNTRTKQRRTESVKDVYI